MTPRESAALRDVLTRFRLTSIAVQRERAETVAARRRIRRLESDNDLLRIRNIALEAQLLILGDRRRWT